MRIQLKVDHKGRTKKVEVGLREIQRKLLEDEARQKELSVDELKKLIKKERKERKKRLYDS